MPRERLGQIYQYLCKVAGQQLASGLSDGQLVDRFVSQRDEAAFEVLLWRHGSMVLNVCKRILHQEQDAEDAFQATFLTFVRKARSIARQEAVAGWLYKVAFRVALAAKARGDKGPRRECIDVEKLSAGGAETGWNDVASVLDEEMSLLPARYRLPVVLCYLEGKTNEEAARALGCPAGTIFSRLSRGREMLRARLERRGLVLPAGLLLSLLTTNAASASLASPLVQLTLKTALLFASGQALAGVSARALTLAEGALKTMFLTKLKTTFAVAITISLLVGAGALGYLGLNAAEPDDPPAPAAPPARPGKQPPQGPQRGTTVVHVVKPQRTSVERVTTQPARIVPFEQVDVYALVAGILKDQRVDIGDKVKKGQLLAQIDNPTVLKEEENASSNLESTKDQIGISEALLLAAQADLQAAKLRTDQHQAEVKSAKANLSFRKSSLDRYKELAKRNAIDVRQVDEEADRFNSAEGRVEATTAGLQAAKGEIQVKSALVQKARADLLARQGAVRAAQTALDKARILTGFTKVIAPFDGIITRRNFTNADFVRSAEQGNAKPLFTLTRVDRMRVIVQIDVRDVAHANPGDPADLMIPSLPNHKLTGRKISRLGYVTDEITGTMRAEIDVDNRDNLLRPGMFGQVTIRFLKAPTQRLTLPRSCFPRYGDGSEALSLVYVVRDGKAHLTKVRTGQVTGDRVEVVSGLTSDDLVVDRPGEAKLKGDAPVPVKTAP